MPQNQVIIRILITPIYTYQICILTQLNYLMTLILWQLRAKVLLYQWLTIKD